MKIGYTNELSNSELPRHREDVAKHTVVPTTRRAEETDKLELSQSSKLEASASGQDVRAEVVAKTKAAIDDGEFKVDASKIATKMIHESASLLEVLTATQSSETTNSRTANDNAGTPQNSQEKFGAGPATERKAGPDR